MPQDQIADLSKSSDFLPQDADHYNTIGSRNLEAPRFVLAIEAITAHTPILTN